MVNPEIDQEIEKWGRKEPRETPTGTETEQPWIASQRALGPESELQEGPGSPTSHWAAAQDQEREHRPSQVASEHLSSGPLVPRKGETV